MKKFSKLLLVIVMCLALFTGCGMKENVEMNISKEEDVSLSMVMALDYDMIDTLIRMSEPEKENITDEERWTYLENQMTINPEGFEKEKYEEAIENNNEGNLKYLGYKYTKKLGKLSDMTTDNSNERFDIAKLFEDGKFNIEKLFVKNGDTYKSNMTYVLGEDNDYSNYKNYGAIFEVNYVVNLPQKAISNNATKVENDGKRLYWDLTQSTDIDFEFKLGGNSMIFIICGIAAGVLLIGAVVVLLLSKKKNTITNN